MNEIIFAGKHEKFESSKNFEIIVSEKVTVIPPLVKSNLKSGGIRITLEKALLPFRIITEISDDGGIKNAAERAVYYFNSDLPKKRLILSALGELIAAYAAAFGTERGFSPAVNEVRAEINKNVSDVTFSLDDFLKKMPLNSDYIRKLFRKETGATPREYLLHKRMKLAQQLICGGLSNRYSEYTVSQIAEACGYQNALYFSRVFKKYFGVSPSEYK